VKRFYKYMNSKNGDRREISRNDDAAASFLEEGRGAQAVTSVKLRKLIVRPVLGN